MRANNSLVFLFSLQYVMIYVYLYVGGGFSPQILAYYMLAASSYGISTCPMEGFDGRRLKHVLNIPER